MSDVLMKLHRNPVTGKLAKMIGLPNPVALERAIGGYTPAPFAGKRVVLARAPGGYAHDELLRIFQAAGAGNIGPDLSTGSASIGVLVFDATACRAAADWRGLFESFHTAVPAVATNARVLIVAAVPEECGDPVAAAAARGIEGFARSAARELGKRGATVNLAYVSANALGRLEGVVRFFCGVQSTYVSGQVVRVGAAVASAGAPALAFPNALAGKVALVTGAAGGIGSASAERLVQEGAQVVCLDIAAASDALEQTCKRIGALPLLLDVTAASAPAELDAFFRDRFGGLDIVGHNAGITRDRTLAKMSGSEWDSVIALNFTAIMRIDELLLADGALRDNGRIVCLSSISGIAGNFGQANYAMSKAALIGYVAARANQLASRGMCINAVAPGFIETAMTARMPFMPRELGRRLNSLQQGGLPRDAAELIAFLCTPGALGISGQTLRVCGQGLVGA